MRIEFEAIRYKNEQRELVDLDGNLPPKIEARYFNEGQLIYDEIAPILDDYCEAIEDISYIDLKSMVDTFNEQAKDNGWRSIKVNEPYDILREIYAILSFAMDGEIFAYVWATKEEFMKYSDYGNIEDFDECTPDENNEYKSYYAIHFDNGRIEKEEIDDKNAAPNIPSEELIDIALED